MNFVSEPKIGNVYKPNIIRGIISILPFILFFYLFFFIEIFSFIHHLGVLVFSPILFIFVIFYLQYLKLKVQSYELRNDGIFVRKGIISKTQALVLYSQVQDVQESQNLYQNIFGIGNLRIITMSYNFPVVLECLNKSDMGEIRGFVLSKTSKSKEKAQPTEISEIEEKVVSEEPSYKIHPLKKGLVAIIILTGIVILAVILLPPVLNEFFNLKFFINSVWFIFGIVIAFVFLTILVKSIIEQISFRLKVAKESIVIGREFLSRNFINLIYEKVQDVGLAKGLLDRLLRMSSITIETGEAFIPTSDGRSKIPLNSISNLNEKDAVELRGIVLNKSGIKDLKTDNLRNKFPLQNIKPLKKSLSTAFWLFVVMGILTVIIYPLEQSWGRILTFLLPILPATVFLVKLIYEIFYFRSYQYSDNNEILILRKGVLTITEVTVPYNKIQNVFINRDIFDRIFGLYDVNLSTVGRVSQMQLHIDGVSKENSDNLKILLLHRVSRFNKKI